MRPALLFDVGKVLIDFDFTIAARRLEENCGHPAGTVMSLFDDIKGPYEVGDISDADFLRLGMERTGFTGTVADLAAIWCEIFAPNEPMWHRVSALAGKLPMHLLSNTNGLHKAYFQQEFAVFRHFAGGVYSHTARCAKPGDRIFKMAVESLGLEPSATFYIDDLETNIETAARLGFRTFHYSFVKHPQFEAELDAWLVQQGIG